MRIKSEPTTSEKVKDTALAVAGLAIEKAGEVKEKTVNDIAPLVAEKAEAAREAAAPHVENAREVVAEKTASQRAAAAEQLEAAKAAAAAKLAEVQSQAEQNRKDVKKATKKASKRADKKAEKLTAVLNKKYGKLEKKATKKYGVGARQDVAYKAAALRGQAEQFAEDKGLTKDNARDLFNDELLPHVKELIAAATAASATATQNAVSQLPKGAQQQVARYAPAVAPQKKKGRGLIFLGVAALGGAGYFAYADQQKKAKANAQLSETAKADAVAHSDERPTVNNPVTDYKRAEDVTEVRPVGAETAEPAGAPGTAATWTEAESTGHMTTEGLEGETVHETRAARRQARGEA